MKKGSIDGVDVAVASAEKLASYDKAAKEVRQFESPQLHDTCRPAFAAICRAV